ncbi:MAG: WhiB family transcriptional regulator [Actinomycetota bacterium]
MSEEPDWTQAACGPEVRHLFFPTVPGIGRRKFYEQAKEICSRCPIRQQCLDRQVGWELNELVDLGGMAGVWGGLTPQERWDQFVGVKENRDALRPPETHCRNGHEYTDDDWAMNRGRKVRACRVCKRASNKRTNAKRRAAA